MCVCANTRVCTRVSVCTRATRADFSLGPRGQACETSEHNTRRERGGRRQDLELGDFAQGHLATSGDSLGCSTPGQGAAGTQWGRPGTLYTPGRCRFAPCSERGDPANSPSSRLQVSVQLRPRYLVT